MLIRIESFAGAEQKCAAVMDQLYFTKIDHYWYRYHGSVLDAQDDLI